MAWYWQKAKWAVDYELSAVELFSSAALRSACAIRIFFMGMSERE
jgi:hypothetical protein